MGAFIGLIGALSFVATTTNLWLSFLVLFFVQAVFGAVGISTYRFASFRVVAIIYTVIFALLVPLVGFSGYRLVLGHLVPLSVPTLIALAAGYAAIVYAILAVYQHFRPYGYLAVVALAVADAAIASDLRLASWWWPAMLMLLAFPALLALRRPGGSERPFSGSWAILRAPVHVLAFAIAGICALGIVFTSLYSFSLDSVRTPLREVRFAILCMAVLLLLWTCLALWRTKRTRWLLSVACLFLACVLACCYAFNVQLVGYVLALTGVALLYHGLTRCADRWLARFGRLSLGLDLLALVLVAVVPLISQSFLPLQLLTRVYQNQAGSDSALLFQFHPDVIVQLLAVALGLAITISAALHRAGWNRTPDKARASWCWLLLLAGILLNWIYAVVVLALGIIPVWSLLGLSVLLVAGAIFVRQRIGAAWANPLDVLVLGEITLTLAVELYAKDRYHHRAAAPFCRRSVCGTTLPAAISVAVVAISASAAGLTPAADASAHSARGGHRASFGGGTDLSSGHKTAQCFRSESFEQHTARPYGVGMAACHARFALRDCNCVAGHRLAA